MTKIGLKIGAAAFAAVAFSMPALAQQDTVKIGFVEPLTGQASFYGQGLMEGANLAAEYINKNGGILGGKKIQIIAQDGQCLPSETTAAAKKLINDSGVTVIVGALCSSATLALQQLTGDTKTVHLADIAVAPDLTDQAHRHPYFFRLFYNDLDLTKVFGKFVHDKFNPETIAFLAVNDDYGRSEVAGLKAEFAKFGQPKVVAEEYFDFKDSDFTSVLASIKAKNPKAMYIVARVPQNATILKQMQSMSFRPPLLAADSGASMSTSIDAAGPAIEGVYTPTVYFANDNSPGAVLFRQAYKDKTGKEPPVSYIIPEGWIAVQVAAQGINNAGTATDTAKIAAAIQKLQWDGPFGQVRFGANGDNQFKVRVGLIKDGKLTEVRE